MYVGCSVLSLIFPPASLTIWPIHLWSAPQCQARPAPSNPPGPSPATTDCGSNISYFKCRILIKTIGYRWTEKRKPFVNCCKSYQLMHLMQKVPKLRKDRFSTEASNIPAKKKQINLVTRTCYGC